VTIVHNVTQRFARAPAQIEYAEEGGLLLVLQINKLDGVLVLGWHPVRWEAES
jgi:hypothetical protein